VPRVPAWALGLAALSPAAPPAPASGGAVRLAACTQPPPAVATIYDVDPTELLSDAAGGGDAVLEVTSSTTRALPESALRAGRSYRLAFTAGASGGGRPVVSVRFREPAKNATFRTFRQEVTAESFHSYAIDFVAPAYTKQPELAMEVDRGALAISAISLKMRPPIARTQPIASCNGSFVPPGYRLVFNDEFQGTALDRSRWFTRFIQGSETGDRLNDENQIYTDHDTHVLGGGVLRLVARRRALSQPSGINYESGMIRSDWTVRYGFFEARVRMPGGLGVFPAFWLNSDVSETGRANWPPEIDIFEFVNNGKDDRPDKIHLGASTVPGMPSAYTYVDPGFAVAHKDYHAPFRFDEGWHTIAAEWTPTELSSYVDGLLVARRPYQWRYKDGQLAAPAHILLNLAIGGRWAGRYGIDDAAFPQALEVDWIRVYQRSDEPPRPP
jgi:beta-glucanase (GH16 family)